MQDKNTLTNTYGYCWDQYVIESKRSNEKKNGCWVGDEWGNNNFWQGVYEATMFKYVADDSKKFVEIGSGAGKQAILTLEHYKQGHLKCFDVSQEFISVLQRRCEQFFKDNRIEANLLNFDPEFICKNLRKSGWLDKVDCFYSFDAMVHVDLQILMTYWITAALSLRVGGHLIMSVADATTDNGWGKLLLDTKHCYAHQGQMIPKFEWLSPDLVQSCLSRLGFRVLFESSLNHRDYWFVAQLEQKTTINNWT